MNKTLLIASVAVFIYFFYSQTKNLQNTLNDLKQSSNTILAIASITKDRLEIKDKDINNANKQIAKYNANYIAFNGTACMRCHLESSNLLPYDNRNLTLQTYVKVVREGIEGVMPAYIDSPKKGAKNITDSELRRQFKILKDFDNEFKGET